MSLLKILSKKSAIKGPITAPIESIDRWRPKIKPLLPVEADSRSKASRAPVLSPFPKRSVNLPKKTTGQEEAPAIIIFAIADDR
ncbi:hypothetical protein A2960_04570 [Candidatus Gottesmanbacteria bacterium RIFCSPLOWO2_01_FULL_39_12b]|uniref:Uncharacterized protein n=1 Tax=Candidatus Gottesmanbacteria bacterium RIFCSPLOWO2_01_FULL_39_12b TaxID=1798388 RepID=A0A1F6ANZ3_9BACT|nr:MAG: hypothetical protein A2960_04570 [Candidatus Gottesmanbacteria bacterium RIFCSPLOWO2_01_FULL_39_12b]